MCNRPARIALLVLILGGANDALAQGLPSAVLSGRVTGEGDGLPGVSVSASSPSLQGTRSIATAVTGDYLFPNLPPGEYTVTFALDGFGTQARSIKLSASQSHALDVALSLNAVAAQATVVGKSETISQTTVESTTYTWDLLTKLPTGRAVLSAVALSPGVSNGPSGPSIAGAQSTENLYTVNGVVIGNVTSRKPMSFFIEDAILETTTMTSSLSAEYGRFTGGVVNAVTKTGGNRFSGSFRSSLSNDAWRATSAYRDPVTGANPQEGTFVQQVIPTWEATFGGPILKDTVWFFAGGRYLDTTDASTTLTRYTNIPVAYGTREARYEGKLTVTPIQNHSLTGSYIGIERNEANFWLAGIPPADLAQFYDRQTPQSLVAVSYNGTVSTSFFLEGFYSKSMLTFQNSGGRFPDPVHGTPVRDTARETIMNAPPFSAANTTERQEGDDAFVKATAFLSSPWAGSHTVVVGYDDFGTQRKGNNFQSGSNFSLSTVTPSIVQGSSIYPVLDAGAWLDYWPVFVESEGDDLRTRSVFLNDTWRLSNRLSFNLGVRYDRNHATDQVGNVTSSDSAWSPRLAGSFDVQGDGTLRVTASYAKYVTALQEAQAGSGGTLAGTPSDFWWYYGDMPGYRPINAGPSGPYLSSQEALRQLFALFEAAGCLPDPLAPGCRTPQGGAPYIAGVNVQVQGSLASPNAQEFVVGLSGSLGKRGTFRADLVRRVYRDSYDLKKDTSTGRVASPIDPSQTYDLGLIVNSNDYTREYTGLHAQLACRVGDRLSLGGAWTWSHLIGDLDGDTRGTLHSYPEYFDRSWSAPVGDLSSDTRHRVRLYGTYEAPLPPALGALTLGFVQAWDTGAPYAAVGSVRTGAYVKNPGYLTPPSAVAYFFTPRNGYRREDVYSTDLSLTYSWRIGGVVELWVSPQLFNVFNSQHVTAVNTAVKTNVDVPSSFAPFNPFTTAGPVECPQGQLPAQCKAMGANWQKGADFGKPTGPTAYQAARTFAVAFGLRF